MNGSEIEQSSATTVELEEPPGSHTYPSSDSYSLPPFVPHPPVRQPVAPAAEQPGVEAGVNRRVHAASDMGGRSEGHIAQRWSGANGARRRPVNTRTRAFRRAFFPDVKDADWNDWRWQSRHRVRKLEQIEKMLVLSDDEREALIKGESMLPVGITPYYMSLLDREDAQQALRRTVIPVTGEFLRTPGEADDPLGEDGHSPTPGLVHRYPDRVLLLALDFCSTYCRYCTRSRVVGHGEIMPSEARLEKCFEYIRNTPAIRDVLISGGDPLALSED